MARDDSGIFWTLSFILCHPISGIISLVANVPNYRIPDRRPARLALTNDGEKLFISLTSGFYQATSRQEVTSNAVDSEAVSIYTHISMHFPLDFTKRGTHLRYCLKVLRDTAETSQPSYFAADA